LGTARFCSLDQLEEETHMKRRAQILFLALLMLLPLLSFAQSASFTDMAGRNVSLPPQVRRVVVLQAADCEIFYAIGAQDLLVGRGEYCNYPAEVLEIPSVQSGFEINLEQIIALEPDAVVMAKMGQREEDAKKLEEAGIAVVVSDAQTIQGVYEAVGMLGELTGHQEEAEKVVDGMKAGFAELAKKAEGRQGGVVYFEASPLEYGLWTTGKDTFMDEIAALLNLTNAFSDLSGWQGVSEEQVIARDPDYIVTTAMYFGSGLKPDEEVLSRPNWAQVKAVKDGKVYNANADEITRPGPRLVEAARNLYAFVYGE